MKNKLSQLLIVVITMIMFSSCYRKDTFISDIDSNKKTVTLYSWVNKFIPFKGSYDLYMSKIKNVPLSKLDSMKKIEYVKMDSVINFYENNNVILK